MYKPKQTGTYFLCVGGNKKIIPYAIGEKIRRKSRHVNGPSPEEGFYSTRYDLRGCVMTTGHLKRLGFDKDEELVFKRIGRELINIKSTYVSMEFHPFKFFHAPVHNFV